MISRETHAAMSRQSKFKLTLGNGLEVAINLGKTTEAPTSMRQTFTDEQGVNRQVRTVKVLANDDVKPQSKDDIEKVIPWTAVQSSYAYRDEDSGEEKLLLLDDKARCQIFKKSDCMRSIGFIDRDEVTPDMFSGDHYFVQPQQDKKSKKVASSDEQGYSLIYYVLAEHKKMLLVKFVSGDREKFAVIYTKGDGLLLSILIHYNYQREAPQVPRIAMPNAKAHAQKMVKVFGLRRFEPSDTVDVYEATLMDYIDQQKQLAKGSGTGAKKLSLKKHAPVGYDDDFLSKLDALVA